MARMQLVELEDLAWFPAILRDGGTAYLEFVIRKSGHGARLAPTIARALAASGATRIVDLCSGGGGPSRIVSDALAASGQTVPVLLTDLYPNPAAYAHAAAGTDGRITGSAAPIDATQVPAELTGLRTIFNAFHHFPPQLARKVLSDAVQSRQPIAVIEVVSREPAMLVALLFSPLTVTLTMPFWRPFRWQWLLWTWILPLMQGFVLWDGVVSWLRIYGVDELRALTAEIDAPDWEWEIGTFRLGNGPGNATFLLGRPK